MKHPQGKIEVEKDKLNTFYYLNAVSVGRKDGALRCQITERTLMPIINKFLKSRDSYWLKKIEELEEEESKRRRLSNTKTAEVNYEMGKEDERNIWLKKIEEGLKEERNGECVEKEYERMVKRMVRGNFKKDY